MILTPIRRYGAMILMLLTLVFSSEVFAKIPFRNTKEKGVSPDCNALHYQPKCGHYCGT